MGSLEAENSGLLGAMIQGKPQSLTQEEQERIALWCVKTGLMLDRVSMPTRIPGDHPGLLFATRRPISHTAIWLTACNDQIVAMSHVIKRLAPELRFSSGTPGNVPLLFGGTGRFKGYLQTMHIGTFTFQILWSESRDVVEAVMGWPDSFHHTRIWPTQEVPVSWPKTIIPTDAGFELFANRIPPPAGHPSTS